MRHILILCSRLDLPAGTERAITNIANLFVSKGNQVSLLVLDEAGNGKSFFTIDSSISVFTCPLHFGITSKGNTITRKISFLSHLRILRKKIRELNPDVVIGTEYPFTVAARIMVRGKNTRIFSWEHHHFNQLKRNFFWETLFKKLYPKLSGVVCLNEEEAILFEQIGCRTYVIPNFLSFSKQEIVALNRKQILTAGWLKYIKGSDHIPVIAKRIFEEYPDWKWRIVGQGEAANALKNHSVSLELNGPVTNMEEEYKMSSIYVLPSRMECFPMVLLEAMSFGVPCIAFDCPTGPRHIIKNGEDGILVEKENTDALVNAIIDLIKNEEKRKEMGEKAFENIKRFSPEKVYELWERLFNAQ